MFASRPVVHPMEVEAAAADAPAQQPPPPWVLMKDVPGMPGTPGGLAFRVSQLLFAAMSLAIMSSTVDFASVTAFWYLVAGAILQCLWSLFLAIVDVYAILVKRCLRNRRAVALFAIGDGITWAVTFSGSCSSAAITVLINSDLGICSQNNCGSFMMSTAMGFMCWLALSPSFILNLRSLSTRA
ncbi:hypothetical protein BS78_01G436800 [Paspalum vaginatum]|nr:hypothetical protein BS78_01G436800 [Paspalum vaginatum]